MALSSPLTLFSHTTNSMTSAQYLNYRLLMQGQYPEYTLYLAIPLSAYDSFFQLPFVQTTIEQYQLKLVVYMPEQQEIIKWQN